MSNWIIMMLVGILSLVAGIVALLNPFGASVVATLITGWSFFILGFLQLIAGLRAEGAGNKVLGALLGLIALFIGINLVAEPLRGMITLTMIAGIMFLASGIFKAWFGFANTQGSLRGAMMISGLVSNRAGCDGAVELPAISCGRAGRIAGHRASVQRHQRYRARHDRQEDRNLNLSRGGSVP